VNVLETAMQYAKLGWLVLPLHGIKNGVCTCSKGLGCEPNMQGKHPVLAQGKNAASREPEKIAAWFETHPHRNLGVVTGKPSDLFVVNIDPYNGGNESYEKLIAEHGEFPVTYQVATGGGGMHFYFQHPSKQLVRTGNCVLAAGIDIKGDSQAGGAGGYVVAPPSLHRSGQAYTWLSQLTLAPAPGWLLDLILQHQIEQVADADSDKSARIPEGQRHNYLARRAGKLQQAGFSSPAILSALLAENHSKCLPPLPRDEVERLANDIAKFEFTSFRLDDVGNGRRFASQYHPQLRHCWATKIWYVWDGTRWREDKIGQIQQLAKKTVESIHEEAATKTDDSLRQALRAHAHASGRAERIRALVEMARSEGSLVVAVNDLDRNKTVLNCRNGLLDLKTGELSAHQKAQLCTKLAPVNYNPTAQSDLWNRFLEDTCGGDQTFIRFLQQVAGYGLSGLTLEEVVFFLHGPGGTGKTTFIEALKAVLGADYCKTASFATFLKSNQNSPNAPRSDIARLAGARLVAAVEMSKGRQLAEDLVKASTGGDTIVTRGLYSAEFEFVPQYKLWLVANDKPRVRSDDTGLWRRLLLIPFYHVPKQPDKGLKDRLRCMADEREAILAWAVKGFQDWMENGLQVPECIRKETNQYRAEMDPLLIWLEEHCELNPNEFTPFRQLWDSYESWLKGQPLEVKNTRIESRKAFSLELQKRGFDRGVRAIGGRQQKVLLGVSLSY